MLKELKAAYDEAVEAAVCTTTAYWGAKGVKPDLSSYPRFKHYDDWEIIFGQARQVLSLGMDGAFPVENYVDQKEDAALKAVAASNQELYNSIFKIPPSEEPGKDIDKAEAAATAAEDPAQGRALAALQAAAVVEAAAEEPLLPGVERIQDEDGDVFYRNVKTGETCWTRPTESALIQGWKVNGPDEVNDVWYTSPKTATEDSLDQVTWQIPIKDFLLPGWVVDTDEVDVWYSKGNVAQFKIPLNEEKLPEKLRSDQGGKRRRRTGGTLDKPPPIAAPAAAAVEPPLLPRPAPPLPPAPKPTSGPAAAPAAAPAPAPAPAAAGRRRKTRRTLRPFRRSTRGRRR
jgi:hypothetical protein